MRVVKAGLLDPIPLGKRGEKNAVEVEFDLSSFIRDFGEGVPGLTVRRPGDSREYAAALERRGNCAYWVIGPEWTSTDGQGRCELSWFVGDDVIAKDVIIKRTTVGESMGVSDTPATAPEQAYLQKVQAAGAQAEKAAEEAVSYTLNPPAVRDGNWWLWDGEKYVDSGFPSAMVGPQGERGEIGPQGEVGPVGPRGPQGPKGEKGESAAELAETDPKYFDIDYDGIVSLKPEYRGRPGHELDTTLDDPAGIVNLCPYAVSDNGLGKDGSKNAELPEEVVIPEVINGTAVAGFQPGMFYGNFRLKKLVLSATVAALPDYFCTEARYLQEVKNTEHIRELGEAAFRNTRIAKAIFPDLRAWGGRVFDNCVLLSIVDIGDHVEEVPFGAFRMCRNLSRILGGGSVKTVGEEAFCRTVKIRNIGFLPQLTYVGAKAFVGSRVKFDWTTLGGCEFGDNSTPTLDNVLDYWSGVPFTPCENSLVTLMNQDDPRWRDDPISETGFTYSMGCATFSFLHISSALENKAYTHPDEFLEELYALTPPWPRDEFLGWNRNAIRVMGRIGYATSTNVKDINGALTTKNVVMTREKYQELCDKLLFGGYAYISQSTETGGVNGGHAVVAYGINEIGEMLIADSSNRYDEVNIYDKGFTFSIPLQNLTGPSSIIVIVEKIDGLRAKVSENSGVLYVDGADDVVTAEVKDGVLCVDGAISARVENDILYVD